MIMVTTIMVVMVTTIMVVINIKVTRKKTRKIRVIKRKTNTLTSTSGELKILTVMSRL